MQYLKKLFTTLCILYLTLVGINIIVDPYDKIGFNLLNLKIKGVFDHRTNKFLYLDNPNNKYEAFILGSSRTMQIQSSIVEKETGYKTFNYAVYTATPEDYLAMTRHIIKTQNPKLIILHIDFYSLNESLQPTNQFFESPLFKYLNTSDQKKSNFFFFPKSYLSFIALKDSIKIIEKNIKNKEKSVYLADGVSYPQYQKNKDYKLLDEYWQNEYKNFKISHNRLSYLQEIQNLCQENRIKLYVSLSPVSYNHYLKIQSATILKQGERSIKMELCKIFPSYVDFFNKNIKEYSTSRYWMDSVHPSTIMATLLTYDIMSNENNQTKKVGHYINCQKDTNFQ